MAPSNCQQCLWAKQETLQSGEHWQVLPDPEPFNPGQLRITHRQHKGFVSLELKELSELCQMEQWGIEHLAKAGFDSYNTFGTAHADGSEHFSVKLIPRFGGDVDFIKACGKVSNLYAPWREEYLLGPKGAREAGCLFCARMSEGPSLDSLVLQVTEHSGVMANKYPYSPGHLMILPRQHTGNFEDLSFEHMLEAKELKQTLICQLAQERGAEAFNFGYNLGPDSGAGLPAHLHEHLVLRYAGDTMPGNQSQGKAG